VVALSTTDGSRGSSSLAKPSRPRQIPLRRHLLLVDRPDTAIRSETRAPGLDDKRPDLCIVTDLRCLGPPVVRLRGEERVGRHARVRGDALVHGGEHLLGNVLVHVLVRRVDQDEPSEQIGTPPRQRLREPAAEAVTHHNTRRAADVLDHGDKVGELRLSAVLAMRRPAQPNSGPVVDHDRADNLGQSGKDRRPRDRRLTQPRLPLWYLLTQVASRIISLSSIRVSIRWLAREKSCVFVNSL
jgi:hypothetical protein